MGVSVHSKRRKKNIRARAKLVEPWLRKQQDKINATLPKTEVIEAKPDDGLTPVKMEVEKAPRRRVKVVVVE